MRGEKQMSQNEKNERIYYRKWRNRCIWIQLISAVLLAAITLFLFFRYYRANRDLYLSYTEIGGADYRVYLTENAYHTEPYLGEDNVYVAELIDHIQADFSYDLAVDTESVRYDYTYRIDTQLEIRDKETGEAIYDPIYVIKEKTTQQAQARSIAIREGVTIDYQKYDRLARAYIEEYELRNITSALFVRVYVDVHGASEAFASDHASSYMIELSMPLAKSIVAPEIHTTVPQSEPLILANNPVETETLKVFMILFAFLTAALLIALLLFIRVTRNKHIEYTGKVERLVANYKSYIQKINNAFDPTGYQILSVASFGELLEIRDTLQSPILMLENKDKTSTKFIVPTMTKLLYLYEIRVEA